MQVSAILVYAIGFAAQGFFSARMMIQWVLSERQKRVVSPTTYWICSLIGSMLLCLYGELRSDFAIVMGQLVSYYIYIWNIHIKGLWRRIPTAVRLVLLCIPVLAIVHQIAEGSDVWGRYFNNEYISAPLLIYGTLGQLLFTLRFVYQWWISYRLQRSELPLGFWVISLIGCFIIVTYGLLRYDPVLVIGQSVGFFTYFRNIIIYKHQNQ